MLETSLKASRQNDGYGERCSFAMKTERFEAALGGCISCVPLFLKLQLFLWSTVSRGDCVRVSGFQLVTVRRSIVWSSAAIYCRRLNKDCCELPFNACVFLCCYSCRTLTRCFPVPSQIVNEMNRFEWLIFEPVLPYFKWWKHVGDRGIGRKPGYETREAMIEG